MLVLASSAQQLPRHGVIGLQVGATAGGPVVERVLPSGAGETAGFQTGDLIKTLDGEPISEPTQFSRGIGRHLAGDTVSVALVRNRELRTLTATLKARARETSPNAEVLYTSVNVRSARRSVIVTRPKRDGRRPAVLLMQGLGCYSVDNLDRETGYGAILNAFEKAGFVTMRVEKTGEGDSQGGPACEDLSATPDLEADGYVASIRLLKSLDYVASDQIFVFAHSIGPVVGSLAIAREAVNGFIAVETVGKSWFEYDLERWRVQSDLSGNTPEEVDHEFREYTRCSYDFYIEKQTPQKLDRIPGCTGFTTPFGGVPYTYMHAVADISLGQQWKNANFPVLVIYGTASPVTSAAENQYLAAVINRLHPGRAQYAEVPGMGHDFNLYAGQAEYIRESGKPEHPFDTALLEVMMPWLHKLTD